MHASFSTSARVAVPCFARSRAIVVCSALMGPSSARQSNPRQVAAVTLSELRDRDQMPMPQGA
jgi:hypothetical protein